MVFHGLVSFAISAFAASSAAKLAANVSAAAFVRWALCSTNALAAAAFISASFFFAASCRVLRSDAVLSSHSLRAYGDVGLAVRMVRTRAQ